MAERPTEEQSKALLKAFSRRDLLRWSGTGVLGIALEQLGISKALAGPHGSVLAPTPGRLRNVMQATDTLPRLLQLPYWGDPGFQNPENYLTIQAGRRSTPKTVQNADIDGDGQAELIGRNQDGAILANQYDPTTGQWDNLTSGPILADYSLAVILGSYRWGWEQPEYYQTIQTADIDGDGKAELIARGPAGILAWKYVPDPKNPHQGVWNNLPNGPAWHDQSLLHPYTTAWDQADRYLTIQCADIDGDGHAELLGRSTDPTPGLQTGTPGLQVWKFTGSAWTQMSSLTDLSDANGWNQPQYYETIQCADIDGDGIDEVIGRDSTGLHVWKYYPNQGGWVLGINQFDFSDANSWGQPECYQTIQCADVDGDGQAEIVGRSVNGIVVYHHNKSTGELDLQSTIPGLADAHGWGAAENYSTIQCADVDGDGKAELIARSVYGIIMYGYANGTWNVLPDGPGWNDDPTQSIDGTAWNMPQYYQTIQTAIVNDSTTTAGKRALLLGRSAGNMQTWKYSNSVGWATTTKTYPQFVSDGVSGSDADQQATAYQDINQFLPGINPEQDIRLQYGLLSDTSDWRLSLTDGSGVTIPKPNSVSQTNWDVVRNQLKSELVLLQNIIVVKGNMHDWYTGSGVENTITLDTVNSYLNCPANAPDTTNNGINIANLVMSLISGALTIASAAIGPEAPLLLTIGSSLLGSASTATSLIPMASNGIDCTKTLEMNYIKFASALGDWFINVLKGYDRNFTAVTRDYGLLIKTGTDDIQWDSTVADTLLDQARKSYEVSLWQGMLPFVWGTGQSLGFPGGYPQQYGIEAFVTGVCEWLNFPAGKQGNWPDQDALDHLFTGLVSNPLPYEVMYGADGWPGLTLHSWLPLGTARPAPAVKLTVIPSLIRNPDNGGITVTLLITNEGTVTLTKIRIVSAQLGLVNTQAGLPSAAFRLRAGQSGEQNLYFPSVAGASVVLRISGVYEGGPNGGGTFGGSFRVKLP